MAKELFGGHKCFDDAVRDVNVRLLIDYDEKFKVWSKHFHTTFIPTKSKFILAIIVFNRSRTAGLDSLIRCEAPAVSADLLLPVFPKS